MGISRNLHLTFQLGNMFDSIYKEMRDLCVVSQSYIMVKQCGFFSFPQCWIIRLNLMERIVRAFFQYLN